MKTRFGSLVVVLGALLPTGCKMCCPSYDYCSPTNPGASQSEMCGKERRGSIFTNYTNPGEQVMPGETVVDPNPAPPVPQPTAAPQPAAQPMSYSPNASQWSNSARRNR